ncbi:hypothetical protein J1614_011718 [Plenodomus biglobosus]|nr:hypothetical protein J1614_011718 [Plenodomus biglobosus]
MRIRRATTAHDSARPKELRTSSKSLRLENKLLRIDSHSQGANRCYSRHAHKARDHSARQRTTKRAAHELVFTKTRDNTIINHYTLSGCQSLLWSSCA